MRESSTQTVLKHGKIYFFKREIEKLGFCMNEILGENGSMSIDF